MFRAGAEAFLLGWLSVAGFRVLFRGLWFQVSRFWV